MGRMLKLANRPIAGIRLRRRISYSVFYIALGMPSSNKQWIGCRMIRPGAELGF